MHFFFISGGLGKIRRNHENTNEVVQHNHLDLQDVKSDIREIKAKLEELFFQVNKATFQTVMDGVDLSETFPVMREEQLAEFMNRNHPDWPARRKEFYNFMFTCIPKDKKELAKAILKALFSRTFMSTTKWPTFGLS